MARKRQNLSAAEKAQQALDAIDQHDIENRLREETEILESAKTKGKFEYWLAETLISHGRTMRIVAATLPHVQMKDACSLAHAGKVGKVALLGEVYKIPLSVLIGGGYIVYLVHKFAPTVLDVAKTVSIGSGS